MKPAAAASHGFLGEEFLTWIWFRWETDGGEFALGDGRTVGVVLDDLLTFVASNDQETEHTLRHGLPTRTPEARTALRAGRRLRKARILVADGTRQWQLTLDANAMSATGVRLPDDDEEATSNEERNADRVANWLQFQEILEALYGVFLKERLRSDFASREGRRMARWMAGERLGRRA